MQHTTADTDERPAVVTTEMALRLFTPRDKKTGKRIKMRITFADYKRYDLNSPKPCIVHDYLRNKDFIIKQAPCGLGCKCDATYELA